MLHRIIIMGAGMLMLSACGQHVNSGALSLDGLKQDKVVYGEDSRLDLYQVEDQAILELAKSTVALVRSSSIRIEGDTAKLRGSSYAMAYGLCEEERFYDQKFAAFCSGSLIGPDLILTAGHCVMKGCNGINFVFDYNLSKNDMDDLSVPASSVYSCTEVVKFKLDDKLNDYAIVRLDREVMDRKPLNMRMRGDVSAGTDLFVIGHPTGLPTKVADGASVRNTMPGEPYFKANLDTYGGNSGSAVFNSETYEIEGILVRGEEDFVSNGSCTITNYCPDDGCRGEDVTKISTIIKDVNL